MLLTIVNRNHNLMCCNNENKSPFSPLLGTTPFEKRKIYWFSQTTEYDFPWVYFFTIFRTICCVRFKNFYQQQSCKCANQDSEKFTRKNLSLAEHLTTIWESNRQQICCCSCMFWSIYFDNMDGSSRLALYSWIKDDK